MGREVAQDRRARGSWEFVAIVQGKLLLADHSIGRPKWGVENLFDGERVLVRGTVGPGAVDHDRCGKRSREHGWLSIREAPHPGGALAAESRLASHDGKALHRAGGLSHGLSEHGNNAFRGCVDGK
jgi:hypothetical protein